MKNKIILAAKWVVLLLLVLLDYIFWKKHSYGTVQPVYIALSAVYFFLLLFLSFLFGKSKAYFIIISIFFGNVLIITFLVFATSLHNLLAAYVLVVGVAEWVSLLPLFPLIILLQTVLGDALAQIIFILFLYGMMVLSCFLGRKFIGSQKCCVKN